MRGLDYLQECFDNQLSSGSYYQRAPTCLFRPCANSVEQALWPRTTAFRTKLAPSPTDYRRLALYAVLMGPVSLDLQPKQSVPRNTAAKSPTSTKAQIRQHGQTGETGSCAHLDLAGGRSQQATTQAKPEKRPRDRTKQLILPAPANVATFADRESTS